MQRIFIALRMAGVAGQEKLSGVFRFLGENHDWDVTLVRTAAEFTPARVRRALADGYDGFIVSIPDTEPSVAPLAASDVPTVVMDIHDPALSARPTNVVFIRNDPDEIGRLAAEHLLSSGRCRSYAFVHKSSLLEWSVDRFNAFQKTLRANGLFAHELSEPDELRDLPRPVGVLAANDDRGYEVLEFCRRHRMRVPQDVCVLGINNDVFICENCRPHLSSLQPDYEQEGFLAAQALAALLRNAARKKPPVAARTDFVGVKTLVRRDSTADFSIAGRLVQKALVYIRKNALRGISVEDVARHLGCSRRLADLRFRELMGTTIGETIVTTRLDEARRLLAATKMPIREIAASCGYENANSLKNLFNRRFGMPMREWRRRNATPPLPAGGELEAERTPAGDRRADRR